MKLKEREEAEAEREERRHHQRTARTAKKLGIPTTAQVLGDFFSAFVKRRLNRAVKKEFR